MHGVEWDFGVSFIAVLYGLPLPCSNKLVVSRTVGNNDGGSNHLGTCDASDAGDVSTALEDDRTSFGDGHVGHC